MKKIALATFASLFFFASMVGLSGCSTGDTNDDEQTEGFQFHDERYYEELERIHSETWNYTYILIVVTALLGIGAGYGIRALRDMGAAGTEETTSASEFEARRLEEQETAKHFEDAIQMLYIVHWAIQSIRFHEKSDILDRLSGVIDHSNRLLKKENLGKQWLPVASCAGTLARELTDLLERSEFKKR